MDPLDIATLALRLALVLVLYLFLLMVLRSATRALRTGAAVAPRQQPAAPRPTPKPVATRANVPLRLMVVEPGSSGLPAGGYIEVPNGATLGRSVPASIVVADPTVSAEHARLERFGDGNQWIVVDLGSTNGTLVNQALVQGDAALAPGDVLGLGNVRLKVVA
jgi:FHA domain-containing protein